MTRAGEETPRAGEVTARAGEETTRAGEVTTRAGEETTRAGEVMTRAGEVMTRAGEVMTRAGEVCTAYTIHQGTCHGVVDSIHCIQKLLIYVTWIMHFCSTTRVHCTARFHCPEYMKSSVIECHNMAGPACPAIAVHHAACHAVHGGVFVLCEERAFADDWGWAQISLVLQRTLRTRLLFLLHLKGNRQSLLLLVDTTMSQ